MELVDVSRGLGMPQIYVLVNSLDMNENWGVLSSNEYEACTFLRKIKVKTCFVSRLLGPLW